MTKRMELDVVLRLCSAVRRHPMPYREVEERVKDYGEVLAKLPTAEHADLLSTQSARCMGCGTPFCHQTDSGARMHPLLTRLQFTSSLFCYWAAGTFTSSLHVLVLGCGSEVGVRPHFCSSSHTTAASKWCSEQGM